MSLKKKQLAFGPFRLDPLNRLLLRDQKPLPLSPKAFDTLVYLVENSGRLVTRDELMQAVWPDSFVEDANLTVNISLLRKSLGEMDGGKPYIETAPRKGYRFNAKVNVLEEDNTKPAPEVSPQSPAIPLTETPGVEEIAETINGVEPRFQPARTDYPAEVVVRQAALREVISFPATQRFPAQGLPPAGSLEAALPVKRADVVRRRYGLVAGVACLLIIGFSVMWAVWRHSSQPPLLGKQRRLTSFSPELAVTAAAISPDGKFFAYANPGGLYLQEIATGELHALQLPAAQFEVSSLSWFPDGSTLLLDGQPPASSSPSLWTISVLGVNQPVKLGDYPPGVVSPDGSEIALVRKSGPTPEIWLMRRGEGNLRSVAVARRGVTFGSVFWSGSGQRLLYVRQQWSPDSRRNWGAIESLDLRSGRTSIVLSSSNLGGAIGLPDGRIVYSELRGINLPVYYSTALFETSTDPRTGKALGRPSLVMQWDEPVTDLSAAGNGHRLLFLQKVTQRSVYVGDLEQGGLSLLNVRRLSLGAGRDDYPHAWMPGSKGVLFDSDRNGSWGIFKQALDETADEPVIQNTEDEFNPRVSPNGLLLYVARPTNWQDSQPVSLMEVPISGGLPQRVMTISGYQGLACARRAGAGCVVGARQKDYLAFYAFHPRAGLNLDAGVAARIKSDPNAPIYWDVSPDGTRLAYVKFDAAEARVYILSLAAGSGNPARRQKERESEVTLRGWTRLHSINWAADGKGWFITAQFPDHWAMLYASLDGKTHVLRQFNQFVTWALPSPDGRHLAFSRESFSSNVWMLENF